MIDIIVFAFMAVLLVGYAAVLCNGLRRARQRVHRAWSHLEFAWARRDGELSKLLDLCAQDPQCDGEMLERAAQARQALLGARRSHDVGAVNEAEDALRRALGPVYPAAARLRHEHTQAIVQALRFRIRAHEKAIVSYRSGYNEAARALNARLEMLPETLLAGVCGLKPIALLECTAAPDADTDLGLAFSK